MTFDPNIRASDADRDRVASLLREHHAQGRLSPTEFNDRLDRAFTATTVGELDRLLSDLPGIDLYRLPDAAMTRYPVVRQQGTRRGRRSPAWRAAWGVWFTVSLVCFVIWLLTGPATSGRSGSPRRGARCWPARGSPSLPCAAAGARSAAARTGASFPAPMTTCQAALVDDSTPLATSRYGAEVL